MPGRLGIGVRRAKPPGTLRYNHSGRYYTGTNCSSARPREQDQFPSTVRRNQHGFSSRPKTDGLDNNLVTFDRLFAYVIHRGVAAELNRSSISKSVRPTYLSVAALPFQDETIRKSGSGPHPVPGWRRPCTRRTAEGDNKLALQKMESALPPAIDPSIHVAPALGGARFHFRSV